MTPLAGCLALPSRLRLLLKDRDNPHTRQFLRFLVTGVVNTLFGYGVFAVTLLATADHRLALLVANVLGVLFNFLTTGRFVFGSRQLHRLPLFIGGYVVCFLVNLWALDFLHDIGVPAMLAQLVLLPAMVILSFIINKLIVFRSRN